MPELVFQCPVRASPVRWAEKDVFNPAAVVKDGRVKLLFRAEDTVGHFSGTSRIGLATSADGSTFAAVRARAQDRGSVRPLSPTLHCASKDPDPVLFPLSRDSPEWEGGVEDPRVVRTPSELRATGMGRYLMTYTAYDGTVARLSVASSENLRTWRRHGLAFANTSLETAWTKSGAIACRWTRVGEFPVEDEAGEAREDWACVAEKLAGKYWM